MSIVEAVMALKSNFVRGSEQDHLTVLDQVQQDVFKFINEMMRSSSVINYIVEHRV